MDQAFTRVTGARATGGNRVRLLRDGRENYPAWLQAIAAARTSIHFETYIIHDDRVGRQFAAALQARAAAGVRVRVLYDWWGARGATGSRFWRELTAAGVEVRSFNAPRLDSPFGWISRDHRKCLIVDGRVAFVSGLCVGEAWVGDAVRGIEPWRDTGVAIEGPAVADIGLAFAGTWALAGPPLPPNEIARKSDDAPGVDAPGQSLLRVVATEPAVAGLFKLDHVVVAAAERSLWLTDAYFVAVDVVRAGSVRGGEGRGRRAAAGAGSRRHSRIASAVTSRVPSAARSRRAGLRVERADAARQDRGDRRTLGARRVHESQSCELARQLGARRRGGGYGIRHGDGGDVRRRPSPCDGDRPRSGGECVQRPTAGPRVRTPRRGSRRAAAGAISVGSTIGAAITNRRLLGPAESRVLAASGAILIAVAAAILWWPKVAAVPLAVAAIWIALSLILKSWKLHRAGRRRRDGG